MFTLAPRGNGHYLATGRIKQTLACEPIDVADSLAARLNGVRPQIDRTHRKMIGRRRRFSLLVVWRLLEMELAAKGHAIDRRSHSHALDSCANATEARAGRGNGSRLAKAVGKK